MITLYGKFLFQLYSILYILLCLYQDHLLSLEIFAKFLYSIFIIFISV